MAGVRRQKRGDLSKEKKKRQKGGTRREERDVARQRRRDANWVGLSDASPLAWSRSSPSAVVVISIATRPPWNMGSL